MATPAKRPRVVTRQRITLACNACRVKRTKCDGSQPQCTACQYREDLCEYAHHDSKRKPPTKQYVHALQARVESLERRVDHLTTTLPSSQISGTPINHDHHERQSIAPASLSDPLANTLDERNGSHEPVDDLADILGRFNIGDGGELRYFGSRSNFSLLHGRMAHQTSSLHVRAQGYEAARRMVGIAEVSDNLRSHLLDLFWRWQNPWQYLVPQHLFLQDLDANDRPGRFCSPLLLSSVLALASRYSDRPEVRTDPNDPATAGEPFAESAKVMLQYECEAPTTTTVQAAALLSLWETSRDKESLGWMYCGMATRMAFNLGLHLDCSRCVTSGLLTQEDAEARNVAWWGCYVLDKLFNVGLGRPATILDRDITAERPSVLCDLEYRPWTISQDDIPGPSTQISRCVSNAHYTCELFKIISEVLDEVYAPRTKWTKVEKDDHVTQSHLQLITFYDGLPSFLKISPSCEKPALPHIYQLHLQYHVAMILLHRPFLKALHRGESIMGHVPNEDDMHSRACRSSAGWISNIFRIYKANYTLRRIPISAVHCAFTAAIIHLVDATSPNPALRKKARRQLQTCVLSLHDMTIAWAWSRRSILALQLLVKEWSADDVTLGEGPRSPGNKQKDLDQEERSRNLTASSLRAPWNMHEPVMVGSAPEGDTDGLGYTLIDGEQESLDVGWLFDDIFGPSTFSNAHGLTEGGNFDDLDFDDFSIT